MEDCVNKKCTVAVNGILHGYHCANNFPHSESIVAASREEAIARFLEKFPGAEIVSAAIMFLCTGRGSSGYVAREFIYSESEEGAARIFQERHPLATIETVAYAMP